MATGDLPVLHQVVQHPVDPEDLHIVPVGSIGSIWISSAIEKNGFKRGSVDYLYFICVKMLIIYALAFAFGISSLHEIYWSSLLYYYGRVYT